MTRTDHPPRALLVIDLQNDFMPGGPLGVPDADAVAPVVNRLVPAFDLVLATQDWHPADHGSFAANHPGGEPGRTVELDGLPQILWPVHCVQGTRGARLVDTLDRGAVERVFRKGEDRLVDSYSGFFDNGKRRATGLDAYLRARGVEAVWIAGVATDYCVRFSALDALELGYRTTLITDACRGVDLAPGDSQRALDDLCARGAELAISAAIG